MLIKTLCLAASQPAPAAADLIERMAVKALREVPGLQQAQVNRVLRHVPTDYIENDRPYSGVVAQADGIDVSVDLHFADATAARQAVESSAWATLMKDIQGVAGVLFALDSEPNVPVALRHGAVNGGFRRWLLLTRKAATREDFRHAWFGRHASLVRNLPLLDGYVQNLVTARYDAAGQPVAYESLPIDGIAEVCFADEAAMNTSYASDARLPLKDDGRELAARVSTVLVQGRVVR
ncbi:EthD protein [Variovorax sp. PBS-H4]|uniref:EthD domain-containing protein n=1 Tax=Variovorax sp. PBS-H4 TaxID=434008 RepID=UPI001315E650|nr:EthD domain-containing protein [Variovorax sp. PBS-H4]VTU34821.1 EthD protein [Variovorax sp. PBS-H4]